MTDLQLGLIGLGVAIVGGTFAYNKWVEYRHRRLARAVLQPEHDDVLLGGDEASGKEPAGQARTEPALEPQAPVLGNEGRREPVLNDAGPEDVGENLPEPDVAPGMPEALPSCLAGEDSGAARLMPADELACLEAAPVADAAVVAPRPSVREEKRGAPAPVPAALVDPAMDFVVTMELVEPASAHQIAHGRHDVLARIEKPVRWVGYNERIREWELFDVATDQSYRSLRIGLQLADRRGPLSEADHSLFLTMIRELADELMAVADMHDGRVVEQALILDRFCADVDLEIGVNLVSRVGAFSGTKVRALAEAAGMALCDDGYFIRQDENGRALFSMQNMEAAAFTPDTIKSINTHGLTFLIDVPRVEQGERAFTQMLEQARRFADVLQGALVDDNRQPLGEVQLDHIRREYIAKPQAAMSRRGFPAGGPQALRLFA